MSNSNNIIITVALTELEGTISTPGYGEAQFSLYPNNADLSWSIEVPETHRIQITFTEPFHIEGHIGDCTDALTIGDGLEVGIHAYTPGTRFFVFTGTDTKPPPPGGSKPFSVVSSLAM